MAKKSGRKIQSSHTVEGRFDSKAALALLEQLKQSGKGKSASNLTLDFSAATHITAGGMAALKQLSEQMSVDGQNLVIGGMPSEMYKALKIAGISDALSFNHRNLP